MTNSFAPCVDPKAKHFAKNFWQTAGKPSYQSEAILPKGVVEIIFSFADPVPFNRDQQNAHLSTPRCFVTGMSDTPVQLHAPAEQSFFGVELYPAAVKKLLKIPCGEFLNSITDLEAINITFTSLWHQLASAISFPQRISIIQNWIIQRLSAVHEQEMAISNYLNGGCEAVSVTGLAAQFCYSPRQLNRKARELFGMSTEALIGYKRYIHALQRIHCSNETLTRISYDCNYYDQAHFIREFKEYTGLTPGEYRQQKSSLPGHLFEFDKVRI